MFKGHERNIVEGGSEGSRRPDSAVDMISDGKEGDNELLEGEPDGI